MLNKTENQIWADLRAFIDTALNKERLTDWLVLQSYQPRKGNITRPYILMHRVNETNIGHLQHNAWKPGKDGQLVQVSFQLDAVKFRSPSDTPETLTGSDVLQLVRLWFMSDEAAAELRRSGYNILFVGQIRQQVFDTEFDTFQTNPNFVLDLIYKQEYKQPTADITHAVPNLKGV